MKSISASSWLSLLQNPACTIRSSLSGNPGYLRTPANWNPGWQKLPQHLFYFFAQHGCEVEVAGRTLRLSVDDLIWISPGVTFRFRLRPSMPSPLIYRFRFTVMQNRVSHRLREPFRVQRGMFQCRPYMQHVIGELERPDRNALRLRALLLLLGIEMLSPSQHPRDAAKLNEHQRLRLQHYIGEHIGEHCTAAGLARVVNLSPDYFTRIFRRSYDMPPRRWILQQRMAHAAVRLLESSDNISAIADQLGFPSIFPFSRQFKQVFGCSPRAYRTSNSPAQVK